MTDKDRLRIMKSIWSSMLRRCKGPDPAEMIGWGSRGIKVCDRWDPSKGGSLQNFTDDIEFRPSHKHTVDRIDNDGNYEPGNIRWATAVVQANNRRKIQWPTIVLS